MFEEIFSSALEAIAKLKERADSLTDEVSALNENVTTVSTELKGFEDVYATDKEQLQKQIDSIYQQMDRTIQELIAKIPLPKDGVDAVVDYESIRAFIKEAVNALPKAKDGKDGISPTIDYKYIISQIPKPKDGKDGKDGESIKGDTGERGLRGEKGDSGNDGIDGRGINAITLNANTLIFEMSDDTTESVTLPKVGGDTYISNNGAPKGTHIIQATANVVAPYDDSVIFCDCSNGDIEVTIPDLSRGDLSYECRIKKTDSSTNKVIIIPFSTIDGYATKWLEYQNSAYCIVSNGEGLFIV